MTEEREEERKKRDRQDFADDQSVGVDAGAEDDVVGQPAADELMNAGCAPPAVEPGADLEVGDLLLQSGLLIREHAAARFERQSIGKLAREGLADAGIDFGQGGFGGVLFDLGVSSPQLGPSSGVRTSTARS